MKKYIIKTAVLSLFITLSVIQLTGCKEAEMKVYDDKPAIFFPARSDQSNTTGTKIDTAYVTFFHHPGETELKVPFRIKLIGRLLTQDTEYRLETVDSLTTAKADEYSLPEKIVFKKGTSTDSLYITVFKNERLSTESARLVLRIVENENFDLGYSDMLQISLRFDNIASKPKWWDKTIEFVYLGKFSIEKYNVFIEVSKRTDIVGLETWELRQLCLDMKDYISENGITEKDGSEMEIVCY